MRIGIGNTIPERVSLPGQSGGEVIPYEFKFKVAENTAGGAVTILAQPNSFGSFTIKWQDGTTQTSTGSTSITSPAGAGTISINKATDATWCDEFKIVSGQANVTEVVSWGENTWDKLDSAFENCVNLTTFGTGTFKGSTGVDLDLMFKGCTSLVALDLTNWDLTSGCSIRSIVEDCTSLELVNKSSQPIKLTANSQDAFKSTGTSLTNGCVFNLQGLDLSTSTTTTLTSFFDSSKIDPSSNFSNWNFSLTNISLANCFSGSEITGNNSTLDMSGWTTFSGTLSSFFYQFNNTSTATGTKINVTNLNTTNVTSVNRFVNDSKIYFIEGLSTWGAVTYNSGSISMNEMFDGTTNLAISSTDNLSDAFMNSLTPTLIKFAFNSIGKSLDNSVGSEWGAAPNLGTIDLSGITSAVQTQSLFSESRFSSGNIDFTNIKFPTIGMDLYRTFYLTKFSNSDSYIKLDTGVSGSTLKLTRLYDSFNGTKTRKITIGDSVDFSTNVSTNAYRGAFQNASGDFVDSTVNTEIILPTNMDFSNAVNGTSVFLSTFSGTRGIDSSGFTLVALSTCQTNNLLRSLQNSLPSPGADTDIVLDNCKYSGPQALVSNDYSTLISNGWTFGTLAPEAPYFTLSSYSIVTGSESTATINSSYTGGTFTSSNTSIATVNASTGAVTTGADSGTCQIRYTLADGVCYNEVNLAVTIPLIANNFSFNFDGVNDYLQVGPQSNFAYGTGDFTISSWVFPERTNDSYELIWSQGGGASNGTNYLSLFNDQLAYYDGFNHQIVSPAGSIKDNEWQQIAIRRTSGITQLFINGITSGNSSTVQAESIAQPTAVTIGKWSIVSGPQHNFKGKMDELFIYNIALTDAQILDIYNGRLGVINETVDLSKYANLGGNLVYWNRMGD